MFSIYGVIFFIGGDFTRKMARFNENQILSVLLESSDSEEEDAVEEQSDPESENETNFILEENLDDQLFNIFTTELPSTSHVESPSVVLEPPCKQVRRDEQYDHEYIHESSLTEMMGKGHKDAFVWKTSPVHSSQGKIPNRNIVHIKCGPTAVANKASTPGECFKLFFKSNLLQKVLQYTNNEISIQRLRYKTRETSTLANLEIAELEALLGLIILSAALKSNHLNANQLFDIRYSGETFRSTMSKERFRFLLNCLRFDDRETRNTRRQQSKFAPIEDIWDIFISQCKANYKAGSYCTIDEQLVGFLGRCPFRMYTHNKPNKYGIKIVMVCDTATKYMVDAEVYLGKNVQTHGKPLAEYYVLKLVESIKGVNRSLTMDNWFTSVPLAKKLLGQDYKITILGTIRKNKRELPSDFCDINFQNRRVNSSMFLFSEEATIVSYKPKINKIVTLLSSMHIQAEINPTNKKPEIINAYNATKGAVDTFDQMCGHMNCGRKTRRWPLCIFYAMLNMGCINSYVIYVANFCKGRKSNQQKPFNRIDFRFALAS